MDKKNENLILASRAQVELAREDSGATIRGPRSACAATVNNIEPSAMSWISFI